MSFNTSKTRWRRHLVQQRINAAVDHLRPQRWNWSAVIRPLDQRLNEQTNNILHPTHVFSLRYFWLDGLFSAISENFYLSFIPLFILAYGATNGQVGWLTAVANLLGAVAFIPGARLVERLGKRKPLVVWSGGGISRLALLALAIVPAFTHSPVLAIWLIIGLNGLRSFTGNLANPAWTAMVADLVPETVRGRYFGSRNMAMGIAALVITPLAGRLISSGNQWFQSTEFGYQAAFFLAFVFGMVSTITFTHINEPERRAMVSIHSHHGTLREALQKNRGFTGFVVSAFIWNLSLQIAAPFFNVYLVQAFKASTGMIGLLVGVSSLTALIGQQVFGRLLDKKGGLWVQQVCGFLIPVLPFAWVFVTAPWQVALINTLGGFIWAGYNLANFNLLLELTPEEQRPRAVALYQTAVFISAVIGPLLGGYLADAVSFQLLFALSAGGRLLGMVWFKLFTVRIKEARKPAAPAV